MTATYSAKKVFGGSILANDELQGDGLSNPSEQQHFILCYQALHPSGATEIAVNVVATIEYTAIWRELKEVAPSTEGT